MFLAAVIVADRYPFLGVYKKPRRVSDQTLLFLETSTPAAAPDPPFEEACVVGLAEEEYQRGVILVTFKA